MRRPAQFSSPTSSSTNNITTPDLRLDTAQVAPQALGSPMPRPWQDDPRFAIALLTIVILVNVALSLWLSPATPASSIADTTHTAATKSTLTPDTAALPSPEEALLFHLGEAGATVSEQ